MARRADCEWMVGVGSPHGDDAAGWRVAEALARHGVWPRQRIYQAASPIDILHQLDGACDRLVVCDACRGVGPPGSIHCWRWPCEQIKSLRFSGSHDVTLPAALQLAERLSKLPQDVIVWGIELSSCAPGESELSTPVAAAVDTVAQRIARQIVDAVEHHH